MHIHHTISRYPQHINGVWVSRWGLRSSKNKTVKENTCWNRSMAPLQSQPYRLCSDQQGLRRQWHCHGGYGDDDGDGGGSGGGDGSDGEGDKVMMMVVMIVVVVTINMVTVAIMRRWSIWRTSWVSEWCGECMVGTWYFIMMCVQCAQKCQWGPAPGRADSNGGGFTSQ